MATAQHRPDWLLWLVLAGVILDLAISAALFGFGVTINHDRDVARCWNRVLAQAVRATPPTVPDSVLRAEARHCAAL